MLLRQNIIGRALPEYRGEPIRRQGDGQQVQLRNAELQLRGAIRISHARGERAIRVSPDHPTEESPVHTRTSRAVRWGDGCGPDCGTAEETEAVLDPPASMDAVDRMNDPLRQVVFDIVHEQAVQTAKLVEQVIT